MTVYVDSGDFSTYPCSRESCQNYVNLLFMTVDYSPKVCFIKQVREFYILTS